MKLVYLLFACFLLACKQLDVSPEASSFDAITNKYFPGMDTRKSFDELIRYYSMKEGIQEVAWGWTIYPPLSAFGLDKQNTDERAFKMRDYLDYGNTLDSALMIVGRINTYDEQWADVEARLFFKKKEDAGQFFKRVSADIIAKGGRTIAKENYYGKDVVIVDSIQQMRLHLSENHPADGNELSLLLTAQIHSRNWSYDY